MSSEVGAGGAGHSGTASACAVSASARVSGVVVAGSAGCSTIVCSTAGCTAVGCSAMISVGLSVGLSGWSCSGRSVIAHSNLVRSPQGIPRGPRVHRGAGRVTSSDTGTTSTIPMTAYPAYHQARKAAPNQSATASTRVPPRSGTRARTRR